MQEPCIQHSAVPQADIRTLDTAAAVVGIEVVVVVVGAGHIRWGNLLVAG